MRRITHLHGSAHFTVSLMENFIICAVLVDLILEFTALTAVGYFRKNCILDVWRGSKYASEGCSDCLYPEAATEGVL